MRASRPDPCRCERCRVYWQPDLAPSNLWTPSGFLVCIDRTACDERVALADSLDRLLRPLGPADPVPLVSLSPGPSGPPAAR